MKSLGADLPLAIVQQFIETPVIGMMPREQLHGLSHQMAREIRGHMREGIELADKSWVHHAIWMAFRRTPFFCVLTEEAQVRMANQIVDKMPDRGN